jgi:hypothetical protein
MARLLTDEFHKNVITSYKKLLVGGGGTRTETQNHDLISLTLPFNERRLQTLKTATLNKTRCTIKGS